MFDFDRALERLKKKKADEAARLKAIETETDDAAVVLYMKLNDFVSKNNVPATVDQQYRTIIVRKNNGHSMSIEVKEGPKFDYSTGRPKKPGVSTVQLHGSERADSAADLEEKILTWLYDN